jgi:hypothetical protein
MKRTTIGHLINRTLLKFLCWAILKFFLNPAIWVFKSVPVSTDYKLEYEHRKLVWELRQFKAELERDLALL